MSYEVEDEIDWSDGSFDLSPPPPDPVSQRLSTTSGDITAHLGEQTAIPHESESPEHFALPTGVPFSAEFLDVDHAKRPKISRAQCAKVGVHLNSREPTKKDYSNFVLYQANQKTYEAMFLKSFISHALHPDQIAACYDRNENHHKNLQEYLHYVTRSVNRITNKMIWHAHCRSVHMLSNDGFERVPFLNVDRLNQKSLLDFGPKNIFDVSHGLNESWHRDCSMSDMVQYTAKHYPIGVHSAPLEEVDEAAHVFFNDRTLIKSMPVGRVVKPKPRKNKRRGLPGAALRDNKTGPTRGNWLLFGDHQIKRRLPSPGSDLNPPVAAHISSKPPMCDMHSDRTQLEDLVERYGPDALLRDDEFTVADEKGTNKMKSFTWRHKLIEDHKRRLTEKSGPSRHTSCDVLLDLVSVIDHAIARGILLSPTQEVKRRIAIVAAKQRFKKTQRVAQDEQTKDVPLEDQPSKTTTKCSSGHKRKRYEATKRARETPRKKQKMVQNGVATISTTSEQSDSQSEKPNGRSIETHKLQSESVSFSQTHPSGSKTLEPHQEFPPSAYFNKKEEDEKPVWRCGIKHAMGYYYNAGNRKGCPGCFTNVNVNPRIEWMDFYLPSRTYYYQPAPGITWKPSKQSDKPRRSKQISHNGIAKEAYYAFLSANPNATQGEARQRGIEAVELHLQPKARVEPISEPTPEPEPEPEPEPIDLGPHPSGSKVMEHGMDIPENYYWEKKTRDEELAWRCDVNHALGRYYLAGDKKSCPGCGSHKSGKGRRTEMDFYLPSGMVVRQELDVVSWKPRKPYKSKGQHINGNKRPQALSHNQICSKKYWDAMEGLHDHEKALAQAVNETDAELDAREEEQVNEQATSNQGPVSRKNATEVNADDDSEEDDQESEDAESENQNSDDEETEEPKENNSQPNSSAATESSLSPRKRRFEELEDDEQDEVTEYESSDEDSREVEIVEISSDDEDTSDSDSE